MSIDVRAATTTFAIIALSLSVESAAALTMRERWQAENLRWQKISASICNSCGSRALPTTQPLKQFTALVDPIAVLERSSRASARFLAGDVSPTVTVPAPSVNRALASIRLHPSRRYAQLLARRRYAKLIRSRRYAALLHRRRAQTAARAAAAGYSIRLGPIGRIFR